MATSMLWVAQMGSLRSIQVMGELCACDKKPFPDGNVSSIPFDPLRQVPGAFVC